MTADLNPSNEYEAQVELLNHEEGKNEGRNNKKKEYAKGMAEALLAFVLVVIVALAEETIFRGYLILRFRVITFSYVAAESGCSHRDALPPGLYRYRSYASAR